MGNNTVTGFPSFKRLTQILSGKTEVINFEKETLFSVSNKLESLIKEIIMDNLAEEFLSELMVYDQTPRGKWVNMKGSSFSYENTLNALTGGVIGAVLPDNNFGSRPMGNGYLDLLFPKQDFLDGAVDRITKKFPPGSSIQATLSAGKVYVGNISEASLKQKSDKNRTKAKIKIIKNLDNLLLLKATLGHDFKTYETRRGKLINRKRRIAFTAVDLVSNLKKDIVGTYINKNIIRITRDSKQEIDKNGVMNVMIVFNVSLDFALLQSKLAEAKADISSMFRFRKSIFNEHQGSIRAFFGMIAEESRLINTYHGLSEDHK